MGVPVGSNYPSGYDSFFGDLVNKTELTLAADIGLSDNVFQVSEDISAINVPVFMIFATGEIVYAEGKDNASSQFTTVTRGVGGSAAQLHSAGEKIRASICAEHFNLIKAAVIAIEQELGLTPSGALFSTVADRLANHNHSGGDNGAQVDVADLTGHTKATHDALGIDAATLGGRDQTGYTLVEDGSRLRAKVGASVTPSSGNLTVDLSSGFGYYLVTSTGSSETINTISGMTSGDIVVLRADTARTIILEHGTGNLSLPGGRNVVLANESSALLLHDGTDIRLIGVADAWSGIEYLTAGKTMQPGRGYITNDASSPIILTLPEFANVGDRLMIIGYGDGGWEVHSNTNVAAQKVIYGGMDSAESSSSAIALLMSTSPRGSVQLICLATSPTQIWAVYAGHHAQTVGANYFGDGSDGDVTISQDTYLPAVQDGEYVVKQYNSLIIDAGYTLTTDNRCKGLMIYVRGDCTINGILSMTKRGAYVDPVTAGVPSSGIRLPMLKTGWAETLSAPDFAGCGPTVESIVANQPGISGNGKIYTIERSGAAGGASVSSAGDAVLTPGNNGGSGTGMAGGGGSGASSKYAVASGAGAAGTCFSGGAGGGGCGSGTSGAGDGTANGGPGGAGEATQTDGSAGGGAGNPGGSPAPDPSYTDDSPGEDGTGGVLWLIVGGNLTIGSSGKIEANGAAGGNGGSGFSAGGGGSGGGVVIALYRGTLSNLGTIEAVGGVGGVGSSGGANGGDGGAGWVVVEQVD